VIARETWEGATRVRHNTTNHPIGFRQMVAILFILTLTAIWGLHPMGGALGFQIDPFAPYLTPVDHPALVSFRDEWRNKSVLFKLQSTRDTSGLFTLKSPFKLENHQRPAENTSRKSLLIIQIFYCYYYHNANTSLKNAPPPINYRLPSLCTAG
jgi:hypothetical protein